MNQAICFLALGLLMFSGDLEAQVAPDIGGEINSTWVFDLDGSGELWSRTTFKLKLDHRAGSDVHAFANVKFYTDEGSQFGWGLTEAYVDCYGDKFDLRSGAQVVSWGTAYRINPTDNVNPFDLSEQDVFIPEEKLGVTAMTVKYYPAGNLTLTGVFVPCFVPALETAESVLPRKTLENSEAAFKLGARCLWGWDVSASYFRGKEDYPSTDGRYPDVEIYGGDLIGTIGDVALWAEGAYSEPETADSHYEVVAGGEYTFGNDLYLLGQLYHRNHTDVAESYLMTVLRWPFRDIHTLQVGAAYETGNEILVVFPEMTVSLADAASIVLSGVFVEGDVDGTFLSGMRDCASIKLEYSFEHRGCSSASACA